MRRRRNVMLRRVPLQQVLPPRESTRYVTMARGQWDQLLAEAYRMGWVLLEVDDDERPVAAYQKADGVPQ